MYALRNGREARHQDNFQCLDSSVHNAYWFRVLALHLLSQSVHTGISSLEYGEDLRRW